MRFGPIIKIIPVQTGHQELFMSRSDILGKALVAVLALGFGALSISAQKPPSQDVSDQARKVGKELNQAYKKWLSEDVKYIITKEEERAFRALQTDEERENFIEYFWR